MKDDREALRLALSTPKPELANEILALRAENERLREAARQAKNVGLEEAAEVAAMYSNCRCGESKCLSEADCHVEEVTSNALAAAIRALKEPSDE